MLVRDYAPRYDLRITCNDRVNRMPAAPAGLLWEQIGDEAWTRSGQGTRIDERFAKALARHVTLQSGGTADDRRARGADDDRRQFRLVHRKGRRGVSAQPLRLRGDRRADPASGISPGSSCIDFVDMKNDRQRAQVSEALQNDLSRERQKTSIHGFTTLGLLEMTRKRMSLSLRDMLKEPCDVCGGTGYKRKGKQSLA